MKRIGRLVFAAGLVLGGLRAWAALDVLKPGESQPTRESRTPGGVQGTGDIGENPITLSPAAQQRIGLKTMRLEPARRGNEVLGCGTLQEDPSQSFTLRAPLAGTLREAPGGRWPTMDRSLAAGATVGVLDPILRASSQVNVADKLAVARGDIAAASASLAADRAEYERLKTLVKGGEDVVAEHRVQSAKATMVGDEARLQAAQQTLRIIESAMAEQAGPAGPLTLRVPQGGRVVALLARPGEIVEAGRPLLRITNFQTLLAVAFPQWRHLLLVVVNLPFALVGGVLAVWATGGVLSIGSLVGFVTLFGITTRNSMMMVSHFEHLVAHAGMTWGRETALRGASERLVPILMTALATGLGLLPIAIASGTAGREIEGPMALVILGGLATSTVLSLLVLPTLALRFGPFERVGNEESP